jgi:diguanylate cyclase (GGDEF)-like protein/PAS domain S-box-containing protein
MQLARSEHDPVLAPATDLSVALALLERLPMAVLALDQDGYIRFANAQVVHLFRYAQAEFIGQAVEFLFPTTLRVHGGPTVRQWSSGAERVAAAASLPVQGMRKDGMRLHLHLRRGELDTGVQPLTLCIIEADRDIPAMQDLALTEARLNEAQRIARIGSWAWNLANDTHWWSDELYRMLRLDRSLETRPYERFRALVNPDDRSRLDRTRERIFAGEKVDPAEVRVTLADGTELIIETRGEATLDESGRPLTVSGTLQDVTQQKVTQTALRLTQTRYRDTQRMARIGNWEADIGTADSWWSEELYHILDEDPATYPASFANFLAHVHPDDRRSLEQRRQRTVIGRNIHIESEARLLLPRSGIAKIVQLSIEVREDERGNPVAVVGTVHDITERRALEMLLRESEARYASTVELAAVGIAHVDPAGHLIWSNSWLRDMLGYTQEELKGLTVWQISHPDDVHIADNDRGRMHASELDWLRIEKRYLCKDGKTIWVKIAAAPRYDLEGKLLYDIAIVEDITPRKIAEERIRYLATHDELTGLPNRAAFAELLGRALEGAQRHDGKCAILFVDLDRFKIVNDSLGHEAGDKVLKEVAQRLRACVRSSDVVGRFGGDEFIVLLDPITDHAAAAAVAASILSAMLRPVRILSYECRVTASIGIARFPEDASDAATLMKQADMGMYLAKDEGKNNFQFYSGVIAPMSVERIVLETHLVHALERNELFLEYQPKIQLSTGRICGVEALLRWKNPQLGVLSPNAFVTLAEDTGLIVPIGKWVLRTACAQSMAWQRLGLPPLVIAVNLSPRQFKDPALVEVITAALQESGLPPHCLELEITETMIMNSVDQAAQTAAVIKSLGVRLAIDDFGTGYSSLSQLKQFPIDTLKIDRSFIRELPGNPDDQAITEAIISLGKALGVNIVAEGVETAAQEQFLRERACDEVQGFLYSKPCDAQAFVRFFTQGNARAGRP